MLDRQTEYQKMAEVEEELWWYRTLHNLVIDGLQRYGSSHKMRIIDAGCGTGGLLLFLRAHGFTNVAGFDVSPYAVQICHERGLPVQAGDLRELPKLSGKQAAEAIISNDTLYFFSAQERTEILWGFREVVAPGGLLLLNLPALPAFHGIHDLSVGIQHRFSKAEVIPLLKSLGFEVLQARYWPFLLSPLIYVTRLDQRLRMKFSPDFRVQSDIKIPPCGLNRIFESVTRLENSLLPWKPFGSSLFVVARKLQYKRV